MKANTDMTRSPPPKLQKLLSSLPLKGAVRIDLVERIPLFRVSSTVQNRIDSSLAKQRNPSLTMEKELDCYEEIDDYLSYVNRMLRNQD